MRNKQIQLGNLISNFRKIFVKFSTRVMTNKNEEHVIHLLIYVAQKKNKEDGHLFQNVCANWISAYFHFPQVC